VKIKFLGLKAKIVEKLVLGEIIVEALGQKIALKDVNLVVVSLLRKAGAEEQIREEEVFLIDCTKKVIFERKIKNFYRNFFC